ncbi:MAG: thioredoxin domain-containing protein [Rhodothermales bacterium]
MAGLTDAFFRTTHGWKIGRDRTFATVACLGLLLVVHLWIMQERGFDRGCLGFSAPTGEIADCNAVVQSEASTLLGLPNVVWGGFFYLGVLALTSLLALSSSILRTWAWRLRTLLILGGWGYALYLVYVQYAVIGEFCVLCLTSAALVTVLLGLVLYDLFTSSNASPMRFSLINRARELTFVAVLAVSTLLLAGADVGYFTYFVEPPATADVAPPPSTEDDLAALQAVLDECAYDAEIPAFDDYLSLINNLTPTKGNTESKVHIFEYFDPNCPHCKHFDPVMTQFMSVFGDHAQLHYMPLPLLGDKSVAQVLAMIYAQEQGRFEEMKNAQFDIQDPRGLTKEQIMEAATKAGLDADAMITAMESGQHLEELRANYLQAIDMGVNSVPKVMINGRFITSGSRTVECMTKLVMDEVAKQPTGTP